MKAVDQSGGYGMLIGPQSTRGRARRASRALIEADPRGYIAQPTIALSRHPTLPRRRARGRHVDLRPFVLSGADRSASCRAG